MLELKVKWLSGEDFALFKVWSIFYGSWHMVWPNRVLWPAPQIGEYCDICFQLLDKYLIIHILYRQLHTIGHWLNLTFYWTLHRFYKLISYCSHLWLTLKPECFKLWWCLFHSRSSLYKRTESAKDHCPPTSVFPWKATRVESLL